MLNEHGRLRRQLADLLLVEDRHSTADFIEPAPAGIAKGGVGQERHARLIADDAAAIPREAILALRRPGRLLVVDEAFADAVPGEPESLAGLGLPDVVVLRSLTKTWSLAGLRVGYALGDPAVLARLAAARPHWPLGTLQLEAIAACCTPAAVAEAQAGAVELTKMRTEMSAALTGLGLPVLDGRAPFVSFVVPDASLMRKRLYANGIAVRRCDTFIGMGDGYLRAAVKAEWPVLVDAISEALR